MCQQVRGECCGACQSSAGSRGACPRGAAPYYRRSRHVTPISRRPALVGQVIAELFQCHDDHPFKKFLGHCNDKKAALDRCLKEEKKAMRKNVYKESRKFEDAFEQSRAEQEALIARGRSKLDEMEREGWRKCRKAEKGTPPA